MSARSVVLTSDNKLRAPWRILIFLVATVAAYYVTALLASALVSAAAAVGVRLIVFSWVSLVAILASTYVALRWVDGKDWSFVRLGSAAARPGLLGMGLVIGAIGIGVPSLLLLATHELKIVPADAGNWLATAGRAALLLLPAAFFEELLLRGYIFSVLREAAGWKWALIATSVVFGLLHAANPGADAQSILVVIVAGFFLGTIVLVTDSLYAAWMAHFAWNWTMAGALHTAVSGLGLATPNYRVIDNGPDWLTGGPWGPEGGVAAALGMFTILFYLYGRHLRRLGR